MSTGDTEAIRQTARPVSMAGLRRRIFGVTHPHPPFGHLLPPAGEGEAAWPCRIPPPAVARGDHLSFPAPLAMWLIMPFEHAEDLDAQRRCVALFSVRDPSDMTHWAQLHLDIIARFGRFPHRNAILGRNSTPEELAFLAAGGFSG